MLPWARLNSGPVASFTDPAQVPVSEFTAVINWGDGQTSTATVVARNGHFVILGGHTYTNPGSYTVQVTVTDSGGQATTITTAANVSNASSGEDSTGSASNQAIPLHGAGLGVSGLQPRRPRLGFSQDGSVR
jgi:hypothetical protein